MADLIRFQFPAPEKPFGADIPDFDLGNQLIEELRQGRITLQRARETVRDWGKEGRIALAREAARRFRLR